MPGPGVYRGPCGRGIFGLSSWKTPVRRPGVLLQEAKAQGVENKWSVGTQLMMKFKYAANTNSPLGKELTVKPKDTVEYISTHQEHSVWILVKNEAGEVGYVPANYVTVAPSDENVKSMPWLDNKTQDETVTQEQAEFKPYKSAYAPKEKDISDEQQAELYYCKVCEKKLNGPIPYKMHLNSKAHKDEMEVHEYNNS